MESVPNKNYTCVVSLDTQVAREVARHEHFPMHLYPVTPHQANGSAENKPLYQ